MRLLVIFALLAPHIASAQRDPVSSIVTNVTDFPYGLPINDIGASYIFGQIHTQKNTSLGLVLLDGPVQCGPGSPCVDKSCCNSDGKCGFEKGHCHPDPPSTCISNCDAKAWCGKDSPNGKITCGLNVCCSKYGWCGWRPEHCGEDTDPKDPGSLCQKEFGRCGKVSPPSCGKDSGTATNGRKIAYYASWNTRNRECNRIWPHHINTEGLTHINFAFAGINPKSFVIQPMHPADPQLYLDFTALKTNGLETWIAVGGWDFSNPGSTHTTWSDMVSTKENRKAFIESAVDLMKTYGFQGIDLDWEYPVAEDRGGRPGDTKNQIALFVELREAIGNRFGFSSILAPDFWYLQHMDPFALSFQVDWFNYMAYDLHGTWDARIPAIGPRIAAHTNLHEIEEMLVSLWFNKLDPKKINFGMAHYGRGFTVKDKGCMHEGCEWADTNKPADCTNFPGIMSNTEIIQLIREKNLKPELLKGAEVKQITWDDQWMAYDDDETRAMKIEKANDLCMGGHFFWAIDYASGSGTGDDPDLDDGTPEHPNSLTDVYIHPGVWWNKDPTVQCIPPCTVVLPPFTLPAMTTISWPDLTTTLLSYEGGITSTVAATYESDGKQATATYLTVSGASSKTVMTTVSVPPFTTNKIDFWPISIDDTNSASFIPVPRIMPPPVTITLGPGLIPFAPTPYPHTFTATETSVNDTGPTVWPTGEFKVPVYPQPTIGIELPTGIRRPCLGGWCDPPPQSSCSNANPTQTNTAISTSTTCSADYWWPTAIMFKPEPPRETCVTGCGLKMCSLFGCDDQDDGSGSDSDSDSDGGGGGGKKPKPGKKKGGKKKNRGGCKPIFPNVGCGCGPLGLPAPCPPGDFVLNIDVNFGWRTGSGSGGGGGGRGRKGCGSAGCHGGCGIFGCGGGCGLAGCGGGCVGLACNPCPLDKCAPGCNGQACGPSLPPDACKSGPCPPNPTGGDPNKPHCEEKDKTTVTDYFVSCTKFNPTSSSCSTTKTVTLTGCGLTPTTTTTSKAASCTRIQLSLDDPQGDDEAGRESPPPEKDIPKPTVTQAPTATATPPSESPPTPPMPLPKPPGNERFSLRIKQTLSDSEAPTQSIQWTLINSKGNEVSTVKDEWTVDFPMSLPHKVFLKAVKVYPVMYNNLFLELDVNIKNSKFRIHISSGSELNHFEDAQKDTCTKAYKREWIGFESVREWQRGKENGENFWVRSLEASFEVVPGGELN